MTTANLVNFSIVVGASSSKAVTQGRVTFAFSESYVVGNYADGPAYVVVPSGTATITAINPAQSMDGANVINGAQKNPAANTDQGYDQRAGSSWNASLTADLPLEVSAGDVVVKAVSLTPAPEQVRHGVCSEFASLFVVSKAPRAGAFAPPACGWTGRTTLIDYHFDLDAIVAALPEYSTTAFSGAVHAYSEVLGHLAKHVPALAQQTTNTNPTGGYESMLVAGMNGLGGKSNYGEFTAETFNRAYVLMISDATTRAQKKELLKWLLHHGIQWWFPHEGEYDASGYLIGGNGGHHQYTFIPVMLAIKHTGGAYADHRTKFPANQLAQTFQVTADMAVNRFVKHTGNSETEDKPYPYRVRPLSAVPSATEISWVLSAADGDASQSKYIDLNIYDASDDSLIAEAITTSYDRPSKTFTANVGVHGLTTSDSIYFKPPFDIVAGEYNWVIRQAEKDTGFNTFNPAPNANYRGIQNYTASAIAAQIETDRDSAYDALIGYTERANGSDDPAGYDLPDCHGRSDFVEAFWNTHWGTITG